MRMKFFSPLLLLFALPVLGAFPEICEKCWYEVPNSSLDSVLQTPAPPPWGKHGYAAITDAWNGAAYDLKNNRLIIAGHGSGNVYAGNEVYAFDLDSLKWFRIKDAASQFDGADTLHAYYLNGGAYPDSQQPRPGSTFDAIEHDSTTNSLFILGVPYAYKWRTAFQHIHQLQLDSMIWSHPNDVSSDIGYGGSVSAKDPATGRIWVLGNGQGAFMSSFDPLTGIITDHGNYHYFDEIPPGQTAAIMPSTNRFISLGGGEAFYWNIVDTGGSPRYDLAATGCDSLIEAYGPGLEWSPADRKFIGWNGGANVIVMDSTYTCTEVEPDSANTVIPGAPEGNGTYGRWRYIPKHNVFILFNRRTGNVLLYRFSAPPNTAVVEIMSPEDNHLTNQGTIAVEWEIDGVTQTAQTTEVLSLEGANTVVRCFESICDSVTVIRDQTPPVVVITSPASSHITTASTILVKWTVDAVADSQIYNLDPGTNQITITHTDAAGNVGGDAISVTQGTYVSGFPIFPSGATLTASNIRSTSMDLAWTAANASYGLKHYVLYRNKTPIAKIPGTTTTQTVTGLLMDSAYDFRVEAVDLLNQMSINGPLRTFRTANILPPDPATVASAIPSSQPTILSRAVAFLYEGPNSVQSGVIDSLMDPTRTVVLKGVVKSRESGPLSGVTVSLLNHPEVGSTLTRANGEFDLVINGGGNLVIQFQAKGYLEAQRTITPRWQEYWIMDTVSLIAKDTAVTTVDFSSSQPMQTVLASVVSDSMGTRQAALLIPSNTEANLVLPDGSLQSLDSMRVRITEYTVGPSGPSAMPGTLPPTSGYTYAVEYTVEEAQATEAQSVVFENPIYGYLENFIGIPVGYAVPAAYYDKARGVWVPSDDGRVIKIAAIQAGKADLVVDTTGNTASDGYLDSVGITDAERVQLADLYAVNQTLWRVPIRHFSSADYNYPVRLAGSAIEPSADDPKKDGDADRRVCKVGSIIDCYRQSLGESVDFPGLPSMQYRSHRVSSKRWYRLEIKVTDSTLPASVVKVKLLATIAGRKFSYEYEPQTDIIQVIEWDGTDAYGRKVRGKQPYAYSISYTYEAVYAPPPVLPRVGAVGSFDFGPRTFGTASGLDFPVEVPAVTTYDLSDTYTGYLGAPNIDVLGPGWTLDNHHVYDPTDGELHMGDGRDMAVTTGIGAVQTLAGGGGSISSSPIPALSANIGQINGLAAGADGSVYVAVRNQGIWKLRKDGMIHTLPGAAGASELDVAADGTVYYTQLDLHRIRKWSATGGDVVFAGTGIAGFSGDGGPAVNARLSGPNNAALGPDGSLYIADRGNHRIRRVTPDGIIQTIAGTGTPNFNGDSLPALQTNMGVNDLDIAADGSIYVSDVFNRIIRKIDIAGIVTTVAGTGASGTLGDGGPALEAQVVADRIKIISSMGGGTLIYLSDEINNTIRRIDEKGIINRIGGGGSNSTQNGIVATFANLGEPRGMAIDAHGDLYVGNFGTPRLVRKIRGRLPGFTAKDIDVPSPDGDAIFRFSPEGRHLKTFHAFTGKEILSFTYDLTGRLTHITDAYANVTEIERNASGYPTSLVNPYAQSLDLSQDVSGNLTEITLPSDESHAFTYNGDGLMSAYMKPRGQTYAFTYDSLGRLVRDDDPSGGYKTLALTDTAGGVKTTITTAMNRTDAYMLSYGDDLTMTMTIQNPAGLMTTTLLTGSGVETTLTPDGTTWEKTLGPDPLLAFQGLGTSKTKTATPSGLDHVIQRSEGSTFSNASDPLTLATYTSEEYVNGRGYTKSYLASSRRWISTTPEGLSDTTFIDSLGRVIEKRNPGIEPMHYAYDSRGRLASLTQGVGGSARVTYFTYNAAGYLASIQDAEGRMHGFTYDLAGRVTEETLPDGRVVEFAYDPDGNVSSIAPPGRPSHGFTYTPVGLDSLYAPPSLGGGNWNTLNGYNLDRQLLAVNRPDNQLIAYTYDTGGRLDSITIPGGAYTFHYHPTTGQIDSVVSPYGVATAYAYDGFLPTSVIWSGGVSGSYSLEYDDDFHAITEQVNGGHSISMAYDQDAKPIEVGDLDLAYHPVHGRLQSTVLGGLTDSITYTGFGEVSQYLARSGGDTLFHALYARDKLGRITEKTETLLGVTQVFEFVYDSAGRLAETVVDGTDSIRYAYDLNGNRLMRSHPFLGTDTGSYDNQDRLVGYGGRSYAYNTHGDLTTQMDYGDTTHYIYDAFGNLVSVRLQSGAEIDYVIDGHNRRVGRKVNGALQQGFLYKDTLEPIAELDSTGVEVSRFVYASRAHVPDYMVKGGVTYRIVSDHLGSVRLVVNVSTGTVVQRIDYDEFGEVTYNSNPGFQPFGFAGGLYDGATGLVRFGARDYDARVGRWTVKDPIGFDGRDNNLYAYVSGDPINFIDVTGLEADRICNGRPDPLQKCLKACEEGAEGREKYCRTLKNSKAKAACWALVYASENACKGWCFWKF